MTRIVCISDTHLAHDFDIPEGDVLVHAGDMTYKGTVVEITEAADWLRSLKPKFRDIVVIAGNHDWLFETNHSMAKSKMRGLHYLEDSFVSIRGLKFYGAPWQPEFANWAFNLPRGGALLKKWKMIPDDTDVLVTHGPPYGILDAVKSGGKVHYSYDLGEEIITPKVEEHVGCYDLKEEVLNRIKPKLHVFGHIHSSHGKEIKGGIQFVNAAVCDETYDPTQPPIVIDLVDQ